MTYRRREQPISKVCQQCQSKFTTWHAGRIYCGQACNMTAWRHRHKLSLPKALAEALKIPPKSVPGSTISFSLPNIATLAAGSLLADGVKGLVNDEPTVGDLIKRLDGLEHKLGHSMGTVVALIKTLQDHHKGVERSDPSLALNVSIARQQRLKRGR